MALNGDTRRSPEHWHGKPPTHSSFDSWINKNGKDAYRDFVKDHPKTGLSYEAWRQTDQVYGGYLFYVASLIWAEDGESDEDSVKRRRISRVQSESKKTAISNGNGAPRTAGSATPTPATNLDEISASGKRKRKPRKKYMSQELVASDEEAIDELEAATPAENETPTAPETTVKGRRKSASRKPRKKPISDETISPEDENEDVMDVDTQVFASPLPVRPAPRTSIPTKQSESPKKATPKQASVKKSRTSFLSEEMVLDEDADDKDASIADVSRPATTPAAKAKPGTSSIQIDANADGEDMTAEGTPDANTRRGLRNRKPAQKRPYYHDAQVFEEVETEQDDESELESMSREQSAGSPQSSRPKHFKGKGRAWKKDGSDEDEEFVTPREKKATKAAKAKADKEKEKPKTEEGDNEQDITWALMDALDANLAELGTRTGQTNGSPQDTPKQKKTRKPRKSNPTSEFTRDEAAHDTPQPTPTQPVKVKRGRGRPRKSVLSSEIVRDDSDHEAAATRAADATTANVTSPKPKPASRPSTANTAPLTTPRKRGRPRKSESTAPPAKPPPKAADEAAVEKQRRGSTGLEAEAKSTRPKASVSSAPEVEVEVPEQGIPTPTATGAVNVERSYPREQSAPAVESVAADTQLPALGAEGDVAVSRSGQPAAEAGAAEVETEAVEAVVKQPPVMDADGESAAEPKNDIQTGNQADTQADTQTGSHMGTPTEIQSQPAPQQLSEDAPEPKSAALPDDDDARSAAMSLSSDSEL